MSTEYAVKIKSPSADILPKGWLKVPFEYMAENISVHIEPDETDLDVYVGLEHLDSDSLRIKRWGTPDDVIGIKLHAWSGDIIFGKRRAYQRKVAVADFEAICSAHSMVLRARPKNVVPDFLPFFMQSEEFAQRAVAISEGSLSPTIKWKTLALQEFIIPPKDVQRRIADILCAAEDCIVKKEKLVDETELYKEILMQKMLTKGIGHKSFKNSEMGRIPEDWIVKRIGDVCKVVTGGTPRTSHSEYFGGTINWLKSGDIKKTYIYDTEEKITQLGIENSNAKIHPAGGIAIALSGQGFTRGKTAILKEPMACSQSVAIMIPNSELVSEFLHYNLSNRYMEIRNLTGHQNRSGLNLSIINNINITLPPFPEQSCIAKILSKIDDTIEKAQENINKTKELKKMLINGFLNGGLETVVSINSRAKQRYETQVSE